MAEIPEELLRRSAEAKAKALGLPVEQVLAEMKGEAPPAAPEPEPAAPTEPEPAEVEAPSADADADADADAPAPAPADADADAPADADAKSEAPAAAAEPGDVDVASLLTAAAEKGGLPESLVQRSAEAKAKATGASLASVLAEMAGVEVPAGAAASEEPPAASPEPATTETPDPGPQTPAEPAAEVAAEPEPAAPAVAVAVADADAPAEDAPAPSGNGGGNGATRVAASVTPRPIATPSPGPEGVRTQRLLTVVKAKAIQKTKAEPTDKVSTWPHLMVAEFAALLAVTGLLIIMSVVLQAPLLEQANFNATPNPSKAPWYFLGLQELLSYFDPQIAGVTIPTIVGLLGFMAIPYVDRNPSNKPADRKFAIFLYTFFIMGSGVLTIIGVLFRGPGFNFTYPWADGIWFDDLKDWVNFE